MDHFLCCDVASSLWSALLVVLGCLGLCLDGFSICLLVGGPLEGRGVLQGGKWCLFSFVGSYGGKEIIGALRTW